MGYYLPLKFFKVGPDCAICATRVTAIMSTKTYQAREAIKAERRAHTLINAAGRGMVKAAIFLDNGSVVASPLSVKTLMNSIERAGGKRVNKNDRVSENVKVYEAKVADFDDLEEYEEEEDVEDDLGESEGFTADDESGEPDEAY